MLKVSNKNTTTRGDLQKQAQSFAPYSFIKVVKVFFKYFQIFRGGQSLKKLVNFGSDFLNTPSLSQ